MTLPIVSITVSEEMENLQANFRARVQANSTFGASSPAPQLLPENLAAEIQRRREAGDTSSFVLNPNGTQLNVTDPQVQEYLSRQKPGPVTLTTLKDQYRLNRSARKKLKSNKKK